MAEKTVPAEATAVGQPGGVVQLGAYSNFTGVAEGELSNASYCSDFEDETAIHQAEAAGVDDENTVAATEPEPGSGPEAAAQAPVEALVLAALDAMQQAEADAGLAEQQHSNCHVETNDGFGAAAAAAGASGMADVADLGGCTASSFSGFAEPSALPHGHAPAPSDVNVSSSFEHCEQEQLCGGADAADTKAGAA
jgi:hypothetical protein